jgi:hypothetical protein
MTATSPRVRPRASSARAFMETNTSRPEMIRSEDWAHLADLDSLPPDYFLKAISKRLPAR